MKRKKTILSLLLCAAIVFSFMPVTVRAADIWDGSAEAPTLGTGSSSQPYQIGTAEELAWFAQQVNGGSTGVCAVLTADIELNNTADWANWATTAPVNTWIPIGNGTNKFAGSFDGDGHTVRGIYIGSGDKLGLFGCVGAGGSIQNVRVAESYISGSSNIGGVCGQNNGGSITGCYNHGSVVGSGNFVGGICGDNIGTVTGCYNHGSVGDTGNYAGGICGQNLGTVTGCNNYHSVRGAQSVGGICGVNVAGGTVSRCGNAGSVTSTAQHAGGVCGSLSAATEPRAKILDSFNAGTVQGTTSGGICGYNMQGSITGCYFLNVSGAVGGSYQGSVEATGKSAAAFALGEVAYLLGPLFGQVLGTDQIPVARSSNDDNAVFKLTYFNGAVEHAVQYYNSGSTVSADGISTPTGEDGEYFLRWDNLPAAMPNDDVTATAVFGAAEVPFITTTSLGNAVVGSAYFCSIQCEGSRPIIYSVSFGALPPGLSLDADTGKITGTPTTGGTFIFTIQAENTAGSDTQELSITVEAAPEITTTSLPSGTVGVSYSTGIETEGTSTAFTVTTGTLPAGLSLDAVTGVVSGTPAAAGTYSFTIKAENNIGSDTQELSITVKKAEPAITTNSLPSGTLRASYSAEVEAEGKTPFTFTVSAGSLPAGLSLDSATGIVSGTPTVVGVSTFTVHVVNDAGEDSRELSIEISDQALGSGTPGDPYQIFTEGQLTWFAGEVNGGRRDIHAVLMADIALNDTIGWKNWATNPPTSTWTPIGAGITNRFIGSFDGNNHTISGVYINSLGDYQGLFGYIGANTTIQNLSLTESYIGGKSYVGGICGLSMTSKIRNCYVSATVVGSGKYAGGVCGYNNANCVIRNCYNTGTITGPGLTGGISGINSGTITGCSNAGTIDSNGASFGFGGISGGNCDGGSIIDSCNTGDIFAPNNNNVGGVCGYNTVTITNAYNTGAVTGNSNTGLVCGYVPDTGTITNCYFLGSAGGIGNNLGTGTATGKSADAFASGEVAYLLGSSFGQTLGTDTIPVFRTLNDSNAVFKLTYLNGADEHAVQYYNIGSAVTTAGVANPTSQGGIFSEWAGLPDIMPAVDVTVTAVFATPTAVQLISATADGMAGTTTSTKINLVFDDAITGLTAGHITITDGTGSVTKGELTGSGTTWTIALTSVAGEGDVSVEVSEPEGYTISGTPKTVTVYKLMTGLSITTSSLAEATVGLAYSQTIECSYTGSGTLQFSATGLPGGLSINNSTGFVGGIPDADTQLGSPYSIVIEVTDGSLTDTKTYSLIVNAAQEPVTDASISPDTGNFDVYSPADVITTVTWNSAQSVTDVVYNSDSLTAGTDYSVNGNILTITKNYLATKPSGTLVLTIVFDIGGPSSLTVNITDSTPPCISPGTVTYDLASPADVITTITWNNAQSVTDVVYNSDILIEDIDYTVNGDILNIKEAYLSAQVFSENDTAEFEITFDTGFTTILTVAIANNYAPGSDAFLSDLTVGGSTVNGFAPGNYTYYVELPYGTLPGSAASLVGATANDPLARVDIIRVSTLPGSATVTVTAEDGTVKVYTVNFTVGTVPGTTYIVTFNSNGSVYTTKTVNEGESIGSGNWPSDPTRAGYTFDGWYTGTNGSGTLFTSSTTVNASITVYAKWTPDGGSSHGGGRSRTRSAPTYKADVKTGNGTETTLPVTVNKKIGSAAIEIGSPNLTLGDTVITVPSIPDVGTYSVGIPVSELSMPDGQGTLSLNTDAGSITVPLNMLTGVAGIRGRKAEITIGQGDKDNLAEDVKAAMGDRPLIQLTLSIDDKQTDWNNPDAPVMVSIPYTPTAAELANSESIVIWYIDGSGNAVSVPNGRYHTATGTVTFATTHFSYYAVGFKQVSFKDVAKDAWYERAVSFIAAREITAGTGNGNFSPEAKLTRGEFLVMLMKAYSIAPDLNLKDNFADAGSTYYSGYLAAAKKLGISSGVGNNMFAPEKEITRQEMFNLLYNVLKVTGQLPQGHSGKTLSDFTDVEQIDAWAKEAMTVLVKTGTVGGSNGKLFPANTTTRAEMAQVLKNLLGK